MFPGTDNKHLQSWMIVGSVWLVFYGWIGPMFIRVRVDQASKGHLVDALVPRGDEGRDTLRKA
jgi:hypothetical protein